MPDKRTPENEKVFLDALACTCNVSKACLVAGLSRTTVYEWRSENPDFAARWDQARRVGADVIEDEAIRRAVEGIDEPIYYQGVLVDTVKRYSDTLAIFLLKGAKPEVYKDRIQSEVSGPGGAPIQIDDATAAEKLRNIMARLEQRLDNGEDLA